MSRPAAVFAIASILVLGVFTRGVSRSTPSLAGAWQVDTRHSNAQLITNATTDYGNIKLEVTLGFGSVSGGLRLDENDPAKSSVDLRFYPATSMEPPIAADGKFRSLWSMNVANHTLIRFHSKSVTRTPDGRLQTTGTMILTRMDRSVQADPTEGYAGPVSGPPMIYRVSHEVTLVFDPPANDEKGEKDGAVQDSASAKVFREEFPQLVKAVTATYWPPVIQDRTCQSANDGENYHGIPCTGTSLEAPSLPEPPHAGNAEDIGAARSDFNAIAGDHLVILLHLRMLPGNSGQPAAAGN